MHFPIVHCASHETFPWCWTTSSENCDISKTVHISDCLYSGCLTCNIQMWEAGCRRGCSPADRDCPPPGSCDHMRQSVLTWVSWFSLNRPPRPIQSLSQDVSLLYVVCRPLRETTLPSGLETSGQRAYCWYWITRRQFNCWKVWMTFLRLDF